MIALTRSPSLLVKLAAAPESSTAFQLTVSQQSFEIKFEKLFHSIPPKTEALGLAAAPTQWYRVSTPQEGGEVQSWDLCHQLVHQGFGILGITAAEFAEPDLMQQWTYATPVQHAIAAVRSCDQPAPPDPRLPSGTGPFWFRDNDHTQLEAARAAFGDPAKRVRIAHCDTGYDPQHITTPVHLRPDLQRNFVDANRPNDATDDSGGFFNNLGHGTGTLSLLAGAPVDGVPLGGVPLADVVPVRVANSVVLFKNSAIAQGFDYIHSLAGDDATRVHVLTMSMGGLASAAWADAINALYDQGVFLVTAAGNNFFNLPTHNIVYPARFKRVIAACGVMANGRPYTDLAPSLMAGNYGPDSKMDTALAACTPNTPWARLGCEMTIDHDGQGTSAATPQIAAAAALWIQKNYEAWAAYPEGWMRVEAVRKALFDSAKLTSPDLRERLGRGLIHANDALAQAPASATDLRRQPVDTASFPFLRVLTGLGVAAQPDVRQRMLELEALQISQQSPELAKLLPDPEHPGPLSIADRQRILELLHDAPGASRALQSALAPLAAPVPAPKPSGPARTPPSQAEIKRLQGAINPVVPDPGIRKLRVFAYDPMLGYNPDYLQINETVLDVKWESLQPGPVGEYLEVVDIDPASGCAYAPVDLNHPTLLEQCGLAPSEGNPRFHQQMAYAVAMKTIEYFERALGRVALWSPRIIRVQKPDGTSGPQHFYVPRLRIYPHAIREPNSFYSPDKKALLLGYFLASSSNPGENLPGGTVFCSLSHDVIAHETTHALLDGLHRYFGEPSNRDVLAFHEAFADIVALFQHFAVPEALRDQIRRTQGDLSKQSLLSELARQFGQGIGQYGALRDAIGTFDDKHQWVPAVPSSSDYVNADEPHALGAVLVASVFDAFLNIYRRRSADLIRLATAGTGMLPQGEIPTDLVNRLANEASKTARHVLNICIRALDYCPPVDLRFGDYVRALITADRDLVPNDRWAYRAAFIQGFRRRGIYPEHARNLSVESLCWEAPEFDLKLDTMLPKLTLSWDLHVNRRTAFNNSCRNGAMVHEWLMNRSAVPEDVVRSLGFIRDCPPTMAVNGVPGVLRNFEVHSVRPVRRVGPDGQLQSDLVIEITQTWVPSEGVHLRGGCTLIIDLEKSRIRYVVRKRVAQPERVMAQLDFRMQRNAGTLRFNYSDAGPPREPFAMMHRGA